MNSLKALMRLAKDYSPGAIILAHKRMYGGFRFFKNHKLDPDLDPGEVRLALHLISEIRPKEELFPEERKLVAKLDPRGMKKKKNGQIQS